MIAKIELWSWIMNLEGMAQIDSHFCQRKLRLTKERLRNELRQRTDKKLALLRELAVDRSTDIENKATQCTDRAPCLYACLFCFWLLIVNLLLAQWLYIKGRLNLN